MQNVLVSQDQDRRIAIRLLRTFIEREGPGLDPAMRGKWAQLDADYHFCAIPGISEHMCQSNGPRQAAIDCATDETALCECRNDLQGRFLCQNWLEHTGVELVVQLAEHPEQPL